MAGGTFTAQVDAWVLQTTKRMNAVARQSTNDLIKRASRVASGKTRGGSLKVGYVPRDIGTLAGSLLSTLSGSTILTQRGENSYQAVISNMEGGDTATFAWTAPYARRLHYEGGWMWVDEAAEHWESIVAANVARAKARV